MAQHAFKMLNAEMHVMEPVDLWERYKSRRWPHGTPTRSRGTSIRHRSSRR
jgi:hypothetical protein